MFANRFTALVDACSLVSAPRRDLLLTLAEAEFFRLRWSAEILDETERAIARLHAGHGRPDPAAAARRNRQAMETAFEDALVASYDDFRPACASLPDPGDAHVLAAALKTEAHMIVTENLRHFPAEVLRPLNIEAKSADAFIADTLSLDISRGVAAVRLLRTRLKKPAMGAEDYLLRLEAHGLAQTVDELRPYIHAL